MRLRLIGIGLCLLLLASATRCGADDGVVIAVHQMGVDTRVTER